MSVLEFVDPTMYDPAFGNEVPLVTSPNIQSICQELKFAIRNRERIFVYGDYDMDGFCAVMVWREVFSLLRAEPPVIFQYGARTHAIDKDILRQVRESGCRVVIICDTGSSVEDRGVLALLKSEGCVPIVIDHHVYYGDYYADAKNQLMFNSYEEGNRLGNNEVSGAYASLLVAKVLCEKHLDSALAFNAKVCALASMYSDVVDMSTPIARALYNSVCAGEFAGPALFLGLNQWNYWIGRRLFSYIIAPKINGCFRLEEFGLLNAVLQETDKYRLHDLCERLVEVHDTSRKRAKMLIPEFSREWIGEILLCVHELNDQTQLLHVRNFTGVIANQISKEEMAAVLVVVKIGNVYEGSCRDFYGRDLLSMFSLFCNAGGHPPAFGLSFSDIVEFKRHLKYLEAGSLANMVKQYITLSSSVLSSVSDIDALALYNEYMNTKPAVMISHHCEGVKLVRRTSFNNYYSVGLPEDSVVMTDRILTEGSHVLIEPAICRGVELREMK